MQMEHQQPTLAVVQYIKDHGLEELQKNYAISSYRHQIYNNLVCLSYNQTRAKFDNIITLQSRGLILDETNHYQVICFPYEKFFNFGEPLATWKSNDISDPSFKVYEKYDGSIATLYYYDNKWHVSSSARSDGSGMMGFSKDHNLRIRFSDLFWEIFEKNGYQLPSAEHAHYCFMFEMLTHRHPLVVQHKEEKLILHGARDLTTLQEVQVDDLASSLSWNVVEDVKERFGMNTMDRVRECADEQDPLAAEGYVVCQQVLNGLSYKRVKVKNPEYVKLSLMFYDSPDNRERSFLNLVKTNEGAEFLTYFPHFKVEYDKLKEQYDRLVVHLRSLYEEITTGETISKSDDGRRVFASKVKQVQSQKQFPKQVSDVMFSMYKGDAIEECLKQTNYKNYKALVTYCCTI
jgi:hypothetical protein